MYPASALFCFIFYFLGNYEMDWFPWGALFKCVICIYVLFHNETRECLLEWCMFWKVQILSQMKAVWIMCGECIHNRRVVLSLWFMGGIACSDKKEECQFYQEYLLCINTCCCFFMYMLYHINSFDTELECIYSV